MALFTKSHSILAALILLFGLVLVVSLRWFPPGEALRFTAALPFLLFLPGYLLTRVAFPQYDGIEKTTLAVALSMLTVFLTLFAVERTAGKLTPSNTAATVTAVNLICALISLVGRQRKRP